MAIWKLAAFALLSAAVTGCIPTPSVERDQKMIEECEAFLKNKLVAPSTYKRVDVTVGIPDEATSRQQVFISYDAANSYNTPLRQTQQCDFPYGEAERKIRPLTEIERKVIAEQEPALRSEGLDVEMPESECCMPPSLTPDVLLKPNEPTPEVPIDAKTPHESVEIGDEATN